MWYFNTMIRQYGGEVLDAAGKKCTANSDAGVNAMKVRAMYVQEYKISDPTVSFATNALPADDLPKGHVSMFITHAGSVAQFGPDVMKDMNPVIALGCAVGRAGRLCRAARDAFVFPTGEETCCSKRSRTAACCLVPS